MLTYKKPQISTIGKLSKMFIDSLSEYEYIEEKFKEKTPSKKERIEDNKP